jgi:hypothetical protein
MLTLSSEDTSAYTESVSLLIKLGMPVSVGHHFKGESILGNVL